ncbi:MAG: helix-turn-helix domain-containing protein [candidate division WOR-3 bacterium]
MVSIEYRELMRLDAVVARKKLVEIYYLQANRNISKTARLCGLSRHTVRKHLYRFFAEGESGLKNRSCRPHSFYRKTPDAVEQLVLEVFNKTNYGFRRIAKLLRRRHGIKLSYGTIGKILKRHHQYKPKIKITIRKTGRRYYNHLDFAPFEFIQADVKEVIDGDTLPTEVYTHFLTLAKQGVPLYQFTALDVRTRLRFLAYGQQKSFCNGWTFIVLVMHWLRAFGIKHKTMIQTDWGDEFGGDEGKKIEKMNQLLAGLNAEITRIHKGRKEENGHVERSHKTDDEELYIPLGLEIKDTNSLFLIAYSWVRYYNTKREHAGDNLDGKIPIEYAKEVMPELNSNIALFPPVILDNLSCSSYWQSGKEVCERYKNLYVFIMLCDKSHRYNIANLKVCPTIILLLHPHLYPLPSRERRLLGESSL